jgi:hypothetical protein
LGTQSFDFRIPVDPVFVAVFGLDLNQTLVL